MSRKNIAVLLPGRITLGAIDNAVLAGLEEDGSVVYFCSLNSAIEKPQNTSKIVEHLKTHSEVCVNIEATPDHSHLEGFKKRPETVVANCHSMYFHTKRCFEMMESYSREHGVVFDVVIKFRTEVTSKEKLVLQGGMREDEVYIPDVFDYGGINDQIAYGSVSAMYKYTRCIDYIVEYCKGGLCFHPESILMHHLRNMNLTITRFPFRYALHR